MYYKTVRNVLMVRHSRPDTNHWTVVKHRPGKRQTTPPPHLGETDSQINWGQDLPSDKVGKGNWRRLIYTPILLILKDTKFSNTIILSLYL